MGEGLMEGDGGEGDGQGTGEKDAPFHGFEELGRIGVAWVVAALKWRGEFDRHVSRSDHEVWQGRREVWRTPVSMIPTILRSRASSVKPAPLMKALRRKSENSSSP